MTYFGGRLSLCISIYLAGCVRTLLPSVCSFRLLGCLYEVQLSAAVMPFCGCMQAYIWARSIAIYHVPRVRLGREPLSTKNDKAASSTECGGDDDYDDMSANKFLTSGAYPRRHYYGTARICQNGGSAL